MSEVKLIVMYPPPKDIEACSYGCVKKLGM
jgi:hypothetical protein